MPLEIGTRLGRYEVLGLLGAGGMGEVYRARDAKLDRDVAVKVLPGNLAGDATAYARFEREAKAVAALAHPNILSIFDFGTDEGRVYAAMELLDGETLRARLDEGSLPARKASELSRQIAAALGAAHDRGIVHRDLKPDNIFITRDGQAKVLDFGLASARESESPPAQDAAQATRTSLTTPGTVMGTVGYMSPEQVRSQPVDHRSDIFSFGCVLHEMLSGRRAFQRETAAETMTAILREEPSELETGSATISPALQRVVARCLEKNPEERFHSARDLAFAIDSATSASGFEAPSLDAPPRRATAGRRAGWAVAGLAAVLGLAAGFAIATWLRPPDPVEPVRVRTLTVSGMDGEPTASPDGRMVAFTSNRDGTPKIWLKQLVGGGEQPLTDGPDSLPRFSPDGSSLLFMRDDGGRLSAFRQAIVGGQPRKIVDNAAEATWSPDGLRIAFLRSHREGGRRYDSVGIADAQEGTARIIADSDRALVGLRWSPDGDTVVAIEGSVTGNVSDNRLAWFDTETGEVVRRETVASGEPLSAPVWSADGRMIFALAATAVGDQGNSLSRVVRFDPSDGKLEDLFWAEHLFPLQGLRVDFTRIEIVRPETLVFHRVAIRQKLRQADLGQGDVQAGVGLTRGEGRDRQPVYSADGRGVLFTSNRSGNLDLWTLELDTGELRQLTDDTAQDWDPAFTPDGEQIMWSSDRSGHMEIWISDADGSGARQLTQDGVDAENPTMGRDGEWIVYWSANPEKTGVWKIRRDGSDATRLASGSFLQPEVSPDGRYAAYVSIDAEELRNRILVVDVETGEAVPFQIDVPTPLRAGGIIFGRNRWLPDGRSIVYVGIDEQNRSGIYAQDFVPGEDTTSTRRPLAGFSADFTTESFGISPDGRRITLAGLEQSYQLMLAEGVPGVAPVR